MDVVQNIIEIRKEKGINQELIAEALGIDVSAVSNIEKKKRELKVSELAKIASALKVDVVYLLTYPEYYIKKSESKSDPIEATLQIKLQSDKKDQVLKLVFGENNLEILNK
jgi:transcriptional regulator with XRE-family HTH domain